METELALVTVISTLTVWARLVRNGDPVLLVKEWFTQQGVEPKVGMKIRVGWKHIHPYLVEVVRTEKEESEVMCGVQASVKG